jgi:hypothetical protein
MTETFYTYVIATSSALLIAILGILYKSKCRNIKCCGCIEVDRDVQIEEELDEMKIKNQSSNSV